MAKNKTKAANDAEEIGSSKELYNFLYEACNILRGPVSQDAFKEYITPLLYFKRISDVYDEETKAALELSDGDEEFAALPEQHRFVIPEGCHWDDVRQRTSDIGSAIIGAMRQIELANPMTLYGVLSVFSTANWSNKNVFSDEKLRDLIEHMSKRRLGNGDYAADLMGDAYEMLLKKFADLSKAKAGEFYTPRSVVKLLVRILDPKPGDVTNAAVAKMNLFLHGANDFNIMCGDTLRDPKILANEHLAHFDCVIANPPFSLENWGAEAWKTDRYGRNLWGTPSDKNGDYAWLQHMVASMRSLTGRMAVVLPQGVLFRGNEEGRIREELVKHDYVEAIITLGDKLFYGTGLSPCLFILRDQKPEAHKGKVLMIDGSKILTPQRAQNILSDDDVDELYRLYTAYDEEEDKSIVVTIEQIAQKGYDLSPNKYVTYHKEETKPYSEVLAEFKAAYQHMQEAEKKFREILNREAV